VRTDKVHICKVLDSLTATKRSIASLRNEVRQLFGLPSHVQQTWGSRSAYHRPQVLSFNVAIGQSGRGLCPLAELFWWDPLSSFRSLRTAP